MQGMANTATGSVSRTDQSTPDRRVWLAAYLAIGLGGISALTAFWRSAHMIGLILGILSVLAGAYAQMLSTQVNQRWLAVCGAIAGGFGAALGAAHGGW